MTDTQRLFIAVYLATGAAFTYTVSRSPEVREKFERAPPMVRGAAAAAFFLIVCVGWVPLVAVALIEEARKKMKR